MIIVRKLIIILTVVVFIFGSLSEPKVYASEPLNTHTADPELKKRLMQQYGLSAPSLEENDPASVDHDFGISFSDNPTPSYNWVWIVRAAILLL